MKKINPLLLGKILSSLILILVIIGFFYFETSLVLKIFVILLGLTGVAVFSSSPEILTLIILYLGLYDLYNIRYGLAVPLSIIISFVFIFSSLLFYIQFRFSKLAKAIEKNLFWLYLVSIGLIVLEIFLTMTFWPVDPKTKSLVITVVFFILLKIFYLYINSMLNLKKALSFIIVSIIILGLILLFNWHFGF